MSRTVSFAAPAIALAIISCTWGCAGIRVDFSKEEIKFGDPIESVEKIPVGVVLFADARREAGELGSMSSFLPPPVNTYRTAWVWGTLKFYSDEPLAREFTNAVAAGLEHLGGWVFRCPAPAAWNRDEVKALARRTKARRIVHGTILEFNVRSRSTLADPAKMSAAVEVAVFDESGELIYFRVLREKSSRYLAAGEIAAVVAERQLAETFRKCVEQLFGDPKFREALEISE